MLPLLSPKLLALTVLAPYTPRLQHASIRLCCLGTFPTYFRNPSGPLDNIALVEQPINFFKSEIGCLGVAEVYQRDEAEVQTHEDQITLPGQRIKKCWSNHDHEEIPKPIGRDTDCSPLGADMKWQYFRHQNPRDAVHSCTEREHVLWSSDCV